MIGHDFSSSKLTRTKNDKLKANNQDIRAIKEYSGLPKTIKMERFATKVNNFWPLTFVAKLSILDVSANPGFASDQ